MLAVVKMRTKAGVKMREMIVLLYSKDCDDNQGLQNTGVGSL
jgi:hypothetical protein